MPLVSDSHPGQPAAPQSPFSFSDTRAGSEMVKEAPAEAPVAPQAPQAAAEPQPSRVENGSSSGSKRGLKPLPAPGSGEPADAPTAEATEAAETVTPLPQPETPAAPRHAAVVEQEVWTTEDEAAWQALRDRLFDLDCTEVSILPTPPDQTVAYRVSANIDTRNYEDSNIYVPDEASLIRIIRQRILKYTNIDVPVGGALPPIAAGTFTYSEVNGGVTETARARVQVLSPPATYRVGLVFCKLPKTELDLEYMASHGTLDMNMAHYLGGAVGAGASIIFSGAPGAGKTCLLNACTYQIAEHEKVAILQDVDELPLEHVAIQQKLFTHRATARAADAIQDGSMSSLIDVVKLSRPDRIITGECRDGAMLDHLEASAIFRGALTTIHAKDAAQALDNIFFFANKHPDAPKSDARLWEYIAGNVDLIVHLEVVNERRVVTEIVSVSDHTGGQGKPPLTVLWRFDPSAGTWVKENGQATESLQRKFALAGMRDTHRHPVV